MADANEYGDRTIVEIAAHSMSDLRQVRNEDRTRNRCENHSRFSWRFATPAKGGVSNPPGRPRDRTGRRIGGLLTPPLHQRRRLSVFRARHRTPRFVLYFSACNSPV